MRKHMEKQINLGQLIIAILIAMTPTFYTIWSNSKSQLKEKVASHEVTLENHSLRLDIVEKTSSAVLDKLDKIGEGIVEIKLELKDKKDRE